MGRRNGTHGVHPGTAGCDRVSMISAVVLPPASSGRVASVVARFSGFFLHASTPRAPPARTPVSPYRSHGGVERTLSGQPAGTSPLPTQASFPRRHHPYRPPPHRIPRPPHFPRPATARLPHPMPRHPRPDLAGLGSRQPDGGRSPDQRDPGGDPPGSARVRRRRERLSHLRRLSRGGLDGIVNRTDPRPVTEGDLDVRGAIRLPDDRGAAFDAFEGSARGRGMLRRGVLPRLRPRQARAYDAFRRQVPACERARYVEWL